MAGIRIRISFIWVMYSCLAGFVAGRAQRMFGIFAVGLQMAIKSVCVAANVTNQLYI